MSPNTSRAAKALRALLLSFAAAVAVSATAAPGGSKPTQFSLVSPDWVAAHYNDADVRILDVRPDVHDYLAGHVPNAIHLSENALKTPTAGMPVQYLGPEAAASLFGKAGVSRDSRVVVYSDGENVIGATMIAYALEKLGQPQVMVMDGGYSAYRADHRTSQSYPEIKRGAIPARDFKSLHVTLDQVKKERGKPGVVFLDARPEPAFTGKVATWERNGHIPSALNLDWHALTTPENPAQFRTVAEIRRIFQEKGIQPQDDIILYCGTSREASLEFLALKHLLGYPKVRLYEGSWTEYCDHADLPVETGPEQVATVK